DLGPLGRAGRPHPFIPQPGTEPPPAGRRPCGPLLRRAERLAANAVSRSHPKQEKSLACTRARRAGRAFLCWAAKRPPPRGGPSGFGRLVVHIGKGVFNALNDKLVAGYINGGRLLVYRFQQIGRNPYRYNLFFKFSGYKFRHTTFSSLVSLYAFCYYNDMMIFNIKRHAVKRIILAIK